MYYFLNVKIVNDNSYWEPKTTDEFQTVIANYLDLVNTFVFFPGCSLRYSARELNSFFTNVEEVMYVNNIDRYEVTILRQLIVESLAINWDDNQLHSADNDYILLLDAAYKPYSVLNTTVGECAEYSHLYGWADLINIYGNLEGIGTDLEIMKRQFAPPHHITVLRCNIIKDKRELLEGILKRSNRIFHLSDKHGENRQHIVRRGGEEASPLKCSEAQASSYLKKAVGYKGRKELYYYDSQNSEFLEFKDENIEPKTYHAYHPHRQDEIPEKVKVFILDNLGLLEDLEISDS